MPAAASRAAAGTGLIATSNLRVRTGSPLRTSRTGSPALWPSSSAVAPSGPSRSSSTFAPAGAGVPSGSIESAPISRPSCAARSARAVEAHGRRTRLPVVAVQERLREGADDDARLPFPLPAAIVEPGHVAVMEPIGRRAPVALVAVDEPEPVPLILEAAGEPVDRLDEAAAVARLDVGLRGERAHQRLAGVDPGVEQHLGAAVARDPQRRRPLLPTGAEAAAAGEEDEGGERGERAPDHCWAFERIVPGAVARTSPACLPMQARPFFVLKRLPSASSVALAERVFLPASVTDWTT